MYEDSTWSYVLAILSVVYLVNSAVNSETYKLRHIPTIGGSSTPILSYLGVFRMFRRGPAILDEAYKKYKGKPFKYAQMKGWQVVVSGPLVEELYRAPEDTLSMHEAMKTTIQVRYTLGERLNEDDFFADVVRSQFTRSLDSTYPELHDELVTAFNDNIVVTRDEWTAVPAMRAFVTIVSRASNRAFIGLPECRNPEYGRVTSDFAISITKVALVINLFPTVLQPFVGRYVSTLDASIAKCTGFIGHIIQERLDMREQHGKGWAEKPTDLMQFLVDAAAERDLTVPAICVQILTANAGAVHTTALSFVSVLYRIASNPDDYLYPLREEVEAAVAEHGWNRPALRKMRKLDSFLKESQRIIGLTAVTAIRRAVKDFSFSDGTIIPKGTYVTVPASAIHADEDTYPDPHQFKPWRFVQTHEGDGEAADEDNSAPLKSQFTHTSSDFVGFGHGRHSCPGRFFAMTQLKTMVAHIVATYDVKMENEGVLPPVHMYGTLLLPDTKARVMFRKRQT